MELLDGGAEYSTEKYKIFKKVLDGEIQMISWLDFSNAKLVRELFFPWIRVIYSSLKQFWFVFQWFMFSFSVL